MIELKEKVYELKKKGKIGGNLKSRAKK